MDGSIIYAWIYYTFSVQVLCRESCLRIESSRCRAHLDSSQDGRMGTSSEPALGREGNQVIPSLPYPSYDYWLLLVGP